MLTTNRPHHELLALLAIVVLTVAASAIAAASAAPVTPVIERVSTIAPFPRGLAMVDDTLYVLCRGRVRGAGGVTAAIDDRAGVIYAVDPDVTEPMTDPALPVSERVRTNGRVFATPTAPPFRLWNRSADPPESDRDTDRPYCTLRYHAPTQSFYICAFSGIDMTYTADDPVAFSKNRTDAVLRFDQRTGTWHEVERHDAAAAPHAYPHRDPRTTPPPHGWLNGPDNCLPLGDGLYVVAKENSRLVRYDLSAIAGTPHAPPPPGEVILDHDFDDAMRGHSALAHHDHWLYVACRTSSTIVRLRLDDDFRPVTPVRVQLVARFDPFDPETHRSADITDMTFDDEGRLYVISARPARIYRFTPDPERLHDARTPAPPWLDLARALRRPDMKSENILHHAGYIYVTSGDGYGYQHGADGTVYRVGVGD